MNLNTWQEAIALGFPDCGTPGTLMTLMGPRETTVVYKTHCPLGSGDSKPRCTIYFLYIISVCFWAASWGSRDEYLDECGLLERPPQRRTHAPSCPADQDGFWLWWPVSCRVLLNPRSSSRHRSHKRMGVVSVLAGVTMGCDLLVLFSSSCRSNPLNNNLQGVVCLSLEGPVSIRNELADLASLNRSELLERLRSILILRVSKSFTSPIYGVVHTVFRSQTSDSRQSLLPSMFQMTGTCFPCSTLLSMFSSAAICTLAGHNYIETPGFPGWSWQERSTSYATESVLSRLCVQG